MEYFVTGWARKLFISLYSGGWIATERAFLTAAGPRGLCYTATVP